MAGWGPLSRCPSCCCEGRHSRPHDNTANWVLGMAGWGPLSNRTYWRPAGLSNAGPRDCWLLSSSERHRCASRGGRWHGQARRLLRQDELRASPTHMGCLLCSSWHVHRSAGWAGCAHDVLAAAPAGAEGHADAGSSMTQGHIPLYNKKAPSVLFQGCAGTQHTITTLMLGSMTRSL